MKRHFATSVVVLCLTVVVACVPVVTDKGHGGIPETRYVLVRSDGRACEVNAIQYEQAVIGKPFRCKWK